MQEELLILAVFYRPSTSNHLKRFLVSDGCMFVQEELLRLADFASVSHKRLPDW